MMAKPTPGTPSRHLLDEATSASYGTRPASRGSAPKALIASTSKRRPWRGVAGGDLLTGVQRAGGGLALDHRHVRDGGIGGEGGVEGGGRHRRVLSRLDGQAGAPEVFADTDHALAVGAVHEHGDLAFGRHEGGEHGLHDEGPAP